MSGIKRVVTPEGDDDFKLPVAGFEGSPDEIERQWYEQVYCGRGDRMPQLTWRAVLMGSALGGVLSLTNLYIGLKSGWGFGVAITACILSYAIWTTFYRLGLVRTPMGILENNCMQSTASAAGYSTGTTLISAFAAFIMINGKPLPVGEMMLWVFFLAMLGVTMAIPMKRQMVNVEQLRFPSGTAAAETLRALHSHGEKGMRAARALGVAGVLAGLSTFLTDGLRLVSKGLEPYSIGSLLEKAQTFMLGEQTHAAWQGRTVFFVWDPIFIAAGAITGMRVCLSMLVAGTLCWAVYVPILQSQGLITGSGFKNLVQWTLWGGVACMVTSGLLSFLLQWRSSLRAFRSLAGMFGSGAKGGDSPVDRLEAPMGWFLAGQVVALAALAVLAHRTFGMPLWLSVVAFVLSFVLSLVACRVTGETDTTPVGPMGQMTQMSVGAILPHDVAVTQLAAMNTTLMSANIVSSAAISSADLLTDLKSGYLLGANPRRQFLAQFAGIFTGTVVTVLAFRMLVPDASVLGTDQFPAPAAQSWRAVATAMSAGLSALEPVKAWSILVGAVVGVVLALLPVLFPKKARYFPSAAGVGLAWTFHWYYSLLFFLGALVAYGVEKRKPKVAEEFTFPVASGVIAGGSLVGVAIVFWENGWEMVRQVVHQLTGQ